MRVAARSRRDFVARLAKDPAITFGTRRVARNLPCNAAHERYIELPLWRILDQIDNADNKLTT